MVLTLYEVGVQGRVSLILALAAPAIVEKVMVEVVQQVYSKNTSL